MERHAVPMHAHHDYTRIYSDLDSGHKYHTNNHTANELAFMPMLELLRNRSRSERIVDLGCGTCAALPMLQKLYNGHAYALEASSVSVATARALGRDEGCRRAHCLVTGSLLKLPWADATFDAVVSADVLEHVFPTDVPSAVAELRRVLAPGGVALLSIANGPSVRFGMDMHATQRSSEWWLSQFRMHQVYVPNAAWRALWNRPGSAWNNRGQVCTSQQSTNCGSMFFALTDTAESAIRVRRRLRLV